MQQTPIAQAVGRAHPSLRGMHRRDASGGSESELRQALKQLGEAFAEFKKTNDERLEKLAKGQPDPLLEGKLEGINQKLTELEGVKKTMEEALKKGNRPGRPGGNDEAVEEHKKAFDGYLRKGREDGLRELEEKAINLGSDADGGFGVPEELDRNITQLERDLSVMRSLCNVITVGSEEYKKLVNVGGASSGWVGETDARPETPAPKLAQIAPFFGEIYANPAVTQKALDDIFFDVEAWLADELAWEFDEQEGGAFITGNGTNKPKGFLAYASSATTDKAGTRPFGTLQFVTSGAAAALNNPDRLIDLIHSLKRGYRKNAVFLGNGLTLSALRKLKDSEGNYLWRPGLSEGAPGVLLGYRYEEDEAMPDIAADSIPLAFGDFKRGYTIADVRGTRVLRDPFTNKPFVNFYTTKRVGGGLMDSLAIKLLKIAA
ncbi:HK97 family phage major capsid protein [Pseudomonas citronellolis]|uniref:phage major capsid protein n=1 Tax=Pseudomonas citronellolis TaxID=53408 RepID=UPI000EE6E81A|nr:phage major capsid protein [Pseudomonas citronellolis]GBL59195.1 HK97 family phage major capsid protein [Pseudomonas citronellolis]